MQVHSDTLTERDFYNSAATMKGVDVNVTRRGSRTHAAAFDVTLTGTSGRRPNSGGWGAVQTDDRAATWDEWGIFLAGLFSVDMRARVGGAKHPVYADDDDFHYQTHGRFEHLTQDQQHKNHRWVFVGVAGTGREFECSKCWAKRTYPIRQWS